ncbi:MAG TPA: LpqB family beta-propeller domain-containing protein [Gemmatimonadaceae bacterium]|nr:LpqB family beta-propeller domain-containing protein [Gemmatimonadaceae bacterium]
MLASVMLQARAVYDVMIRAVRGAPVPDSVLDRAAGASAKVWVRALRIEQCGPAVERSLRKNGQLSRVSDAARDVLRRTATRAVRHGLTIPAQLDRIVDIARGEKVDIMALKGAARLLGGEVPGARTVDDIDLLVRRPEDAMRLHTRLASVLACTIDENAPAHHLPCLYPAVGVPIEIHTRLSGLMSPLDELIWRDARDAACGDHSVLLPSETMLLLHTLEHAVVTHWAMRYRLRDVLDVASAWRGELNTGLVVRHVKRSPTRAAIRTLLAAASSFEPTIPYRRGSAWRTIARVGRTRLTASFLARDSRQAERLLTVGGVVAESSPTAMRKLAWLAVSVLRRSRARASAALFLLGAALATLGACDGATGIEELQVPAFVFASNADGAVALYRYDGGAVTRLSELAHGDDEPHAAAGLVAFSSERDGNREIYTLNASGATRRVTNDGSADGEPALSSNGGEIAFVSNRSGTPRIWITDSLGSSASALETGSPVFVPERSPSWSPSGDRIAFTSTRTGTSQVWLVPAGGGTAVQLTHETGGAFDPSWSADGSAILYGSTSGAPRLVRIVVTTGETSVAGVDANGVGEPVCSETICLAVRRPYSAEGDIVAYAVSGGRAVTIVARAGLDNHPAFLAP